MVNLNAKRKIGTGKTGLVLVLAGMLGLSACLTEEDGEEGRISSSGEVPVLAITPPQGTAPGKIVVRASEYECDGTTLFTTSYNDTSLYVIEDGKLYLWYEGECYLDIVLSGSSSTITGTWTADSASFTEMPVPEPYRPDGCLIDEEYEDDGEFMSIFKDLKATYTIRESSVSSRVEGTLCLTPFFAELFTSFGEGVEVATASCGSATLTSPASNGTATVSSIHQGAAIVTTFSYGDSVCVMSEPFDFSDEPPVCSEEQEEEGSAFGNCIYGSGFFGSFESVGFVSTDTAVVETQAIRSSARAGASRDPVTVLREAMRKTTQRLP